MSGREFNEWMAYEKVTGTLGPERSDLHMAMLMSLFYNMWRGKKSQARGVKDFLPDWDKRPQTPEDQLAMIRWMNQAFGGEEHGDPG